MECFWSELSKHPRCPHGPTLLFGKNVGNQVEKFYACSACRERKMCRFYLKAEEKLTKTEASRWEKERKEYVSRYHHRPLYLRFIEAMQLPEDKRIYCHTCEQLVLKKKDELSKHNGHNLKKGLTDHEMKHPTEILKPLENNKQEAQYFFTKQTTEDIVNILLKLDAKQVLCIGTPKIHEYILENHEDKISSLLLDFDARFHNFFGPLNYCWYNLMNNHFFDENAVHVFKDFLTQNSGKDTYLICDPPFGSRVEPMSWTIKRISDLHKKWNDIEDESDCLKILFIFPYFMESIMKQKSNPPGVSGGLKDLKMTDYKVSYGNHNAFVANSNNVKKSPTKLSPIRIFTNVPLNLFELPESSGYKYCTGCMKWVAKENKHCKKCKQCTSKHGLTYVHCNICKRCVKSHWKHCDVCKRCTTSKHVCGEKPKISGNCYKCNKRGHTAKECEISGTKVKEAAKRKATDNEKKLTNNVKKQKVNSKSNDNKLEHTEEESGINTMKTKKATKRKATDKKLTNNVKKQKVNSKSNNNELEHTEEESGINTMKAKKVTKRKTTDKKLTNNVKKQKVNSKSNDNELEHTEEESGINTMIAKKVTKSKTTEEKLLNYIKNKELNSTQVSNANKSENIEKKSEINTAKAKTADKRTATNEKLTNNIKKKKVNSTRESDDKQSKLAMKNKLDIKSRIKVKFSKKSKSLKKNNKAKLHSQLNGIARTKKATK